MHRLKCDLVGVFPDQYCGNENTAPKAELSEFGAGARCVSWRDGATPSTRFVPSAGLFKRAEESFPAAALLFMFRR